MIMGRCLGGAWIAAEAVLGQRVEIALPDPVLVAAEIVEIAPGEDAGIVHVVELDADGVMADRLDRHDADIAPARDDGLLARAMAMHFRRRAFHAQQFRRVLVGIAVVELDLDQLLRLAMADFDRPMIGAHLLAHVIRRRPGRGLHRPA